MKKSRIENAIKEYRNRKNKNIGSFYAPDFDEIIKLSANKYEMVFFSLNAGFIIGYRAAIREIKKNNKK